jgi:hypothetical protein
VAGIASFAPVPHNAVSVTRPTSLSMELALVIAAKDSKLFPDAQGIVPVHSTSTQLLWHVWTVSTATVTVKAAA